MFKKYLKTMASALIIALVVTMFVPLEAAEASSYYSQPAIYTNKIVVDINSSAYSPSSYKSITNTYVDVRVNSGNYQRVLAYSGMASRVTITGVNPYNSYDVKVTYDYYSSSAGKMYYDNSLFTLYDAAMAPVKVTGLRQVNWWCYIGSLSTSWTRQQSVTGYQYELFNNKNVRVRYGNRNYYSASESFSKLASATHKMRVRAYTTFNGTTTYGAWSDWIQIVPPVKKLTGKSKKRKITLKWSKVAGASSYTIYVSTSKSSGYKKTKTVSAKKSKATIKKIGKKKLKSGKRYYVMVRPNKKINGKTYYSTFKNASIPLVYGKVR